MRKSVIVLMPVILMLGINVSYAEEVQNESQIDTTSSKNVVLQVANSDCRYLGELVNLAQGATVDAEHPATAIVNRDMQINLSRKVCKGYVGVNVTEAKGVIKLGDLSKPVLAGTKLEVVNP